MKSYQLVEPRLDLPPFATSVKCPICSAHELCLYFRQVCLCRNEGDVWTTAFGGGFVWNLPGVDADPESSKILERLLR